LILFLDTNTRKNDFFKHFQIKILRTLKWGEYYCYFRSSKFRTPAVQWPLNTDWPFCRESRVITLAHWTFLGNRRRVHIRIKTEDVYISVLKLLLKHPKTSIKPYWIPFIIILKCIYCRFVATIYFIFQFKKLIDFLILIVFKRRKWNFKCDYLWKANGWYNYVPCTCSYNS
jgi:hypothetical protein